MQIFLSHSAADGLQAEQVYLALQELGHEVFFDRSSLPTGESFNDRIRSAIQECEVFVFLVTRNSLREGSYCLTELKFIEERWPHPRGRVLPVMLEPLRSTELPPYLRAVTYLEPRGSVAAETAEAVQRLLRRYQRKRFARIAAAVVLVALAVLGVSYQRVFVTQASNLDVQDLALANEFRELGRGGDVATLSVMIANDAGRPRTMTSVKIETDRPECEVWLAESDVGSAPQRELPLARLFTPGEALRFRWRVLPRRADSGEGAWEDELAGMQWRLSWRWHDQSESHTAWQRWNPSGVLANRALRPLTRDLRHRARCAVARGNDSDAFLLAAANDGALLELPREGAPIERAQLGAEPVAVAVGEGRVAAATLSPTPLWIFDAASWKGSGPFALQTWDIPQQNGGGHFSAQPRELAVWDGYVWIRTGEADHPPMVTRFIIEQEVNLIPFRTFYDYELSQEIFEPLQEVRFATIGGKLWGAHANSSLSDLCSFWQGDLVLYDGHPEPGYAAARDVTEGPGGTFLLLDQEDQLTELVREDGAFHVARKLGQIPVSEVVRNAWIDYRIAARDERIVVATSLFEQEPVMRTVSTRIATWEPRAGLQIVATVPGWEIVSLATTAERGLAVLKRAAGEYDAVWIDYANASH